jgi:hypothetical protein
MAEQWKVYELLTNIERERSGGVLTSVCVVDSGNGSRVLDVGVRWPIVDEPRGERDYVRGRLMYSERGGFREHDGMHWGASPPSAAKRFPLAGIEAQIQDMLDKIAADPSDERHPAVRGIVQTRSRRRAETARERQEKTWLRTAEAALWCAETHGSVTPTLVASKLDCGPQTAKKQLKAARNQLVLSSPGPGRSDRNPSLLDRGVELLEKYGTQLDD